MTKRRVRLVILCEDSQHEAFIRRFLKGMGWNTRELRVEKSPSAGGAAEQWVRERFPDELTIYRQRRKRAASALIVMIDADRKKVEDRISEVRSECLSRQIPFREDGEAVGIAIPKRNIETWIHHLNGATVNERDVFPKLDRERECRTAVANLVLQCRTTGLSHDAPPALAAACDEYTGRIQLVE